jgi:predicted nucleotidyltransferase
MVDSFDELSLNIGNVLRKHPAVARAEVFGSFARGEQTKDSDVDISIYES